MTAPRRLRPGHWLLIGVAVLVLVALAVVVLRRGDAGTPTGLPPSSPPGTSAPPRADCAPEITSSGVFGVRYGFVYRNRCDQVVRELRFRVSAVDTAGAVLTEAGEDTAYGGVLFPGGELATAGELQLPRGVKMAGVKVEVINYRVEPPAAYTAWARVRVVDLVRGKPGRLGTFEVTGTVRAEPSTAPVCVDEFTVIVRNQADKIIYAASKTTFGRTVLDPSFQIPAPPGLDFARTKIYAPQTPRTEQPPSAGRPCDGS